MLWLEAVIDLLLFHFDDYHRTIDTGFVLVGGYDISQFETRFSTDLNLVIAPDDSDEVTPFLKTDGFERQAELSPGPTGAKSSC